jgi:methylated-DNA-[protein]-cysteine S-methyltransferase
MMKYQYKIINSPVGRIRLIASDKAFAGVLWEREGRDRVPFDELEENNGHPLLLEAEKQLEEYFLGKRKVFTIPLDMHGTDFQKKVWTELLNIPFGETRTYGDIARKLGDIKSVRAVGAANGKNPISIIVPCHRVIGASGKLVGFGGGLENKAKLLELESREKSPTLW